MTNVQQTTNQLYNPLFEKMCQRFQLQDGVTIAEAMVKKAAKSPYQTSFEIEEARKAKSHTSGKLLRVAAAMVSLFMFTAVLVGCVHLGTQNDGLFGGIGAIFADIDTTASASGTNDAPTDVNVYEDGNHKTTVSTYGRYAFPAFSSLLGGK